MKKVEIKLTGNDLLSNHRYNKGTAFTQAERTELKLSGLLPPRIESLEEQGKRAYSQYSAKVTPIEKNLFLMELYATNATLFFRVVENHLEELLPIIYTPTIGEAVMKFSDNFLRQHGLIISFPDMEKIDEILENVNPDELDIAVVTDGEGVLGIGDQGVGGLNIAIGKLLVYTACGGINPFRTLPIQLDVGTNNKELLENPFYLGWRHERISEYQYYSFVDKFVECFSRRFPKTFLHWEDFGKDNAHRVLDRYTARHQSFNDDIQGTGAITLAALLTGIRKSGISSENHRFCIFGAGTAGTGIADQICKALSIIENRNLEEIRKRFYLIDRHGLLQQGQPRTLEFQKAYLKSADDVKDWEKENPDEFSLADVVKNAKITVLIGCSTAAGAFTSKILTQMYENSPRPIIMPLSNPTCKAEATPEQIMKATEGNALIATGSPFGQVEFNGKKLPISQCNNALVYPGIGIGMLVSGATLLTETMLFSASNAVSDSFNDDNSSTVMLPGFTNILHLSAKVGLAVAEQAAKDGVAKNLSRQELMQKIENLVWTPRY